MMKPEDLLAIIKDTVKSMFTELANKLFKLGTIPASYITGDPTVLFEGETVVSAKAYPSLYQPSPGDRVLLVRVGSTWIVLGRVEDDSWKDVQFLNGWTNYEWGWQHCQYRKDSDGYVHIRGLACNGTLATPMFYLPPGYRPAGLIMFNSYSASGSARTDISSDGSVNPGVGPSGHNAFYSISGITFKAEQ